MILECCKCILSMIKNDLLFFISKLYDEKEMLKGKLDLLSNTNMVDFAMDVHKTLYPDQEVPQSMNYFLHIFVL